MKVLITTDLFTVRTNGVVTSTHNLIEELERRGHEVRVITISPDRKSRKENNVYYIKGVSMEWVYAGIRMAVGRASKYVKEIVEWKPDIIHSQCEWFTMKFAKRISKKTGAPIIHTYHTLYEDYVGYAVPFKRFGRWYVRNILTKSNLKKMFAIIAPTVKVRDNLIERCKVKNRVEVIPSGISLDKHKIKLTEEELREGRAKYGLTDDNFVLINLGRLGTEKNLEEVVEYFAKVSEKHSGARLFIVGGGPARESLDKLVADLGLVGRVVFAGMVDPDEVARYYQLGDLFVCASTSETQGLTYIEAAANNLPLLCRDDPCYEGVMEDGKNGFRYTTFEEYEKHLDFIISNPEWREKARIRSGEISARFDRTVFGASVEALYMEALGATVADSDSDPGTSEVTETPAETPAEAEKTAE